MTTGFCTSNLVTVVAMKPKLYDFLVNAIDSTENIYCCCDLDRSQTDLVDGYWVVFFNGRISTNGKY